MNLDTKTVTVCNCNGCFLLKVKRNKVITLDMIGLTLNHISFVICYGASCKINCPEHQISATVLPRVGQQELDIIQWWSIGTRHHTVLVNRN